MFTRRAGWTIVEAYGRKTQHYYPTNQTKSICGTQENAAKSLKTTPYLNTSTCKLCVKCKSINKIPRTGRKHRDSPWGGLKY